jgi:hypothetical protein
MPFSPAADVYVVSGDDTGEIHAPKPDQIYDVKRDSDGNYREHHERDLKAIPWHGRITLSGYYYIVDARRDGAVRKRKKQAYRLDGRRL